VTDRYRRVTEGAGLVARLREFYWRRLRRWETEICQWCGGRVRIVWTASDEDWLRVMGHDGGVLCVFCFEGAMEEQGRFIRWVPTPLDTIHGRAPEPGEREPNG
jgi:hypothetical protein